MNHWVWEAPARFAASSLFAVLSFQLLAQIDNLSGVMGKMRGAAEYSGEAVAAVFKAFSSVRGGPVLLGLFLYYRCDHLNRAIKHFEQHGFRGVRCICKLQRTVAHVS